MVSLAPNMNRIRSPKFLFLINAGFGDVCHALPVLYALFEKFPDAYLELSYASDSARKLVHLFFPNVNGPVVSELRGVRGKLRQLNRWRRDSYDYVFSGAHQDASKTPFIAFIVATKNSIGMKDERHSFLYKTRLPRKMKKNHYSGYATLFSQIGISPTDIQMGAERLMDEMQQIAQTHRFALMPAREFPFRVAFANGADSITRRGWKPSLKRIPNDVLLNLFNLLKEQLYADFVLLGIETDNFPQEMLWDRRVCDLRGKTGVKDLISALCAIDLLICNDTATMHLAHFCRTPYLAVFGPTDPRQFAPSGIQVGIVQAHGRCGPCQPRPSCGQDYCRSLLALETARIVGMTRDILKASDCSTRKVTLD
jgi:ADP-heptose:LPS heptosyltransferase